MKGLLSVRSTVILCQLDMTNLYYDPFPPPPIAPFTVQEETPAQCLEQTGAELVENYMDVSFGSSEVGLDLSFASQSDNGSLYMPTPQKKFKDVLRAIKVPKRICFTNLTQLDEFVQKMNTIRRCNTPGSPGRLVAVQIDSKGQGGAISVRYCCNGCASKAAVFEASPKCALSDKAEIGLAVQVAFVVGGCMHSTYQCILKQALGMDAVSSTTFLSAIKLLYPIVTKMVDEMCEEGKEGMKSLDPTELGSWKRAVTSADGAWMIRGFHSSNAMFSIRNYCNGALLYYKHLCQRGRDNVVKDDLFEGMSKSPEGYAACLTFKQAKDEGMNVEVQWHDSDSSSANAVAELFPDAQIMTCGGHAGRAHKKQLEKLSKCKSFSETYQKSTPIAFHK